jgi:hypothetical protein
VAYTCRGGCGVQLRDGLHHLVDDLSDVEATEVVAYVSRVLAQRSADVQGYTAEPLRALPPPPPAEPPRKPVRLPTRRAKGRVPSLSSRVPLGPDDTRDDPSPDGLPKQVVDLLLALEPWLDSPCPALYHLAADARQRWPQDWTQRFCRAYQTSKRQFWEQEFVACLREQLFGEP